MSRLYPALAALFAFAVTSQITYTIDVVRNLRGDYPQKPFAATGPEPVITFVNAAARQAGLRIGDRLVSIAGRAPEGTADLVQPVRARHPGDVLPVVIERNGRAESHDIVLTPANTMTSPVIAVVTWLFTPWLSLALGFWVTALRPRDNRAWMMLGLLAGLALLARTGLLDARGWPTPLAALLLFYREAATRGWAICMMLFGIYFPQRWSVDRRFPWAKWILIVPQVVLGIWEGFHDAVETVSFRAAASIPFPVPDWEQLTLLFTSAGLFFTAIASKYHDPAEAVDDRRRLRLLYWGCTLSMTPSFVLWLFSAIVYHRQPSYGLVATLSLAMMGLFPLTLAYTIVVQRAMDVRMVIRQGVQYALARRGIKVVQALLMMAVVFLAATAVSNAGVSRPERYALIAVGTVFALRIGDLGERVRRWLDRRFFREAYHAEQILSDLSEQVGSILDRDALLQTVSRKIAESLHVERLAVLLQDGGDFRPALATGYPAALDVAIPRESPAPEEAVRQRLDARLVLPLSSRKELLGFISLGPKKSEEPYSPSDRQLLQSVAVQTGLALENTRLTEVIAAEVAQRELLSREIEIAREVQQRLFPQSMPDVPRLEYAGYCRPARGVGGDYYDFLALASGRLGLAIGDVSGKGIPAALLMASLQASVRGQSQAVSGNVAELLTNVNRLVCDATPENRYATFFYAQFDPATARLVYTNGGHNPPILLRGSEVIRLESGGPPVGLFRLSRYDQEEIQLQPFDLLVFFTDGISEAENPREDEWGEDALVETARSCASLPPAEAVTHIMAAADVFAAGAPQHDDMTLVIARVLPS